MARSDEEAKIRGSLDTVERDFKAHFQKAGMGETEAIESARKIVKRRGIGERVEKTARHDPEKAAANTARAEAAARQADAAREAKERAAHAAEKQRTGRKYFT